MRIEWSWKDAGFGTLLALVAASLFAFGMTGFTAISDALLMLVAASWFVAPSGAIAAILLSHASRWRSRWSRYLFAVAVGAGIAIVVGVASGPSAALMEARFPSRDDLHMSWFGLQFFLLILLAYCIPWTVLYTAARARRRP